MVWGEEHEITGSPPLERVAADRLAMSVRDFLKHRSALNVELVQTALEGYDLART